MFLMASFYVLLALFIWSSLGVVVRLSNVPIHVLIFYSTLVSIIIQGIVLTRKKYRINFPKGKEFLYLLILGPIVLLNNFTYFYAFHKTTIANAVFTHYIAPVLVAFLALIFLKEALTKRIIISIGIASIGLWIMVGVEPEGFIDLISHPDRDTVGILFGLLSGVAYAVIIIIVRVFAQSYNPVVLAFFQNLIITIMLLPFVSSFPAQALWSFVLLGALHSTIAPILYFRGMRELTANRTAVLGYLEPVGAIIFSMLLLNEVLTVGVMIGGLLIIFSGYITLKGG